ncbi:hypothetical protein ARMGADRAFT_1057241 [Armillaria gallica]|uniref:Fungal N-terminal domain-containing protein n=1 Tax=Armillaria gallica TaxID=47427 RepID=A0A2H3EN10_ARMGA|nr:hypothetical protein ARMGADRAFT_1057241 [Armillaria gallica]
MSKTGHIGSGVQALKSAAFSNTMSFSNLQTCLQQQRKDNSSHSYPCLRRAFTPMGEYARIEEKDHSLLAPSMNITYWLTEISTLFAHWVDISTHYALLAPPVGTACGKGGGFPSVNSEQYQTAIPPSAGTHGVICGNTPTIVSISSSWEKSSSRRCSASNLVSGNALYEFKLAYVLGKEKGGAEAEADMHSFCAMFLSVLCQQQTYLLTTTTTTRMLGDSNIGTWIQFAKLTVAAGEMAPFLYIKGVAGCIATILEIVELAGKNNEDLWDLAESIGTTIRIIRETIEVHGDMSATCFHDVSGVIDGYKQQVNNIKADYLVLVTTDSRFMMSEMQDALSTTVIQAQSCITSTVKSQAHCIQSEIHSLGDIQREHSAQICEKLQDMKGYYKRQVQELFPGDIYVENLVSPSKSYSFLWYQDRYCTVESSSRTKIIRIFQHSSDNGESILKQFNKVADAWMNIKFGFPCIPTLNKPLVSADHQTFQQSYFMVAPKSLSMIMNTT